MNLNNKNVLLIMPDFYKYSSAICEEMTNQGARVFLFFEEPRRSVYLTLRHIRDFLKSDIPFKLFNMYLLKKIKKATKEKYDYFIVIRGSILTLEFLDEVKKNLLKDDSKTIYYTWDALEYTEHKGAIANWFDKKLSFDTEDVKKYKGYELLPLFYIHEYDIEKHIKTEEIYDVCCIASFDKHRYEKLKSLVDHNDNLSYYIKLYIDPSIYDAKLMIDGEYFKNIEEEYLITEMLSTEEVLDICMQSKALFDITHQEQSGLSIRITEALGLKKKIITDNPHIVEYDFYNDNDCWVVGEDLKLPDNKWFDQEYSIEEGIRSAYSITNWLKELVK